MGDSGHAVGQFGGRRGGHARKVGGKRHLLHLLVGRQRQFLVAVADIYVPQSGHAVEHLAPIGGMQPDALAAVYDEWVVVYAGVLEGMKLLLIVLDNQLVIEYGGRCRGQGILLLIRYCLTNN